MKLLLAIVLCFCSVQLIYSQEDDGVVSLALPIRNSLTFNQYVINPTFSFVRQQNKYISVTNKREWVQFEDAPQTYLVSYSGRYKENIGIGVGLFQQNYGVLTTFGGLLNFAYNARLERDSNLTFGINVGAYKSGINESNVVTNFSDPSLENIPSNFLLSVTPGINYGTMFLDFGVSINNLVLYNINSSELIEDNPEQSIQAHIMYTGYMESHGFFDDSKFSGLIRSEFRKDQTVISAIAMLTVPKGVWAQVGYNSLYGASGGLGLNITNQISIEYNFEKALGNLIDFGPSHDITLAYKFKNREVYDYSGEDEVSALITPKKKKRPVSKVSKAKAEANRKLANERKKAKVEAVTQAKLEAEKNAIAKSREEALAKLEKEQKAKEEIDVQIKLEEENTRLEAEQLAKEKAEELAKLKAEQKARDEAIAKEKSEAEAKAKLEAEQKRLDAERKAEKEAQRQAKLDEEQKAKDEEEAKQKLISNPTDELGKSMNSVAEVTEDFKIKQDELLSKLSVAIANKDKDLKDLKEENDLSEKGIYMEPKPFKSVTAEDNALKAIKIDLDNAIKVRGERIKELEALYDEKFVADTITNDVVMLYYKKTIEKLKSEQITITQSKEILISKLEAIKLATEFERRRRIKRALYDNEEDRYVQDRATLNAIKQNTGFSSEPINEEDFDFGEEQSSNIQILKNVKNVENGYYLIVAVHNDVEKRDEFLTKIVAAGRRDVDFFYDVKTSKYFIYYKKFNFIEGANEALKSKGSKPYNGKMSIVKIEN